MKGLKTEEQRLKYADYYSRVIPGDRPLEDELHVKYYRHYQDIKSHGVIEVD